MTDTDLRAELDRVLAEQAFGPADPRRAIRDGNRIRRVRQGKALAFGVAACVVVTAVATAQTASTGIRPSPAFGDPGSRMSLVAEGGPSEGYPDLVVQRTGRSWVTITGFGWPIDGMEAVSDGSGTVAFPEISKLDAESICLPMLIQAAPEVPNGAWHHSGAWIDDFPTRHGLVTTFGAEHDGRTYSASCTLPGDFSPDRRPDLAEVPEATDERRILAQCSYQGHVDFRAWDVAAVSEVPGTLAAALLSRDGHLGRCVLSDDPRQRLTQVSGTVVDDTATDPPVLYGGDRTRVVTLVGAVPPEVTTLEVEVPGEVVDEVATFDVVDGVYAAAVRLPQGSRADSTVVRGLGSDGSEVFVKDNSVDVGAEGLLPTVCFTTVETGDDGC